MAYYQIPIQYMIAGIQISQIKNTDYYRRFLILQKILAQKHYFITPTHNPYEDVITKYQNLLKQLSLLQNHILIENHQYYSREKDFHSTLQQMEREYQRCFQSVGSTVTHYEKKMMQTWRDGITKNEDKQKIERSQSESSTSNNKNLMLLTSELLKKERQTRNIIQNEQGKILDEINKTNEQLVSKKQALDQQLTKMKQAQQVWKQKLQKEGRKELEGKEIAVQKLLYSLQLGIKICRDSLSQEKKQSEVSLSEIQSLLQQLKPKYR